MPDHAAATAVRLPVGELDERLLFPRAEQAALAQSIGHGGFECQLRRSAQVLEERRRG